MFFPRDELIPRAVVMELHFSEITYWWSLKFCLVVLCMRTVLRSPRPYRVIFLIPKISQSILQSPGLLWFEFGAPLKPRMQGPLPLPWWATAQRIFPACTYQYQECMPFEWEGEKQGNIIHVAVSVAGNFLFLEGQAPLRSSGINAARIWYLVIFDFCLVLKNCR